MRISHSTQNINDCYLVCSVSAAAAAVAEDSFYSNRHVSSVPILQLNSTENYKYNNGTAKFREVKHITEYLDKEKLIISEQ